jgi:ligand-binding sensor domain-containing protein/signal transduction histidine kinase
VTRRDDDARPGRSARPTGVALALGVCLLLLLVPVHIGAERLPIKSYTTSEGLAHNRVNRIVPDSRGFLWLCTAAGLSRFDGYSFLNFGSDHGLPSAGVNDFLETRAGQYWIATNDGLVRFNPAGRPQPALVQERDEAAALAMFVVVLPADPDRRAKAISVVREGRDGTIWVGTGRGLYRLERSEGQHVLRDVDVALANDFPAQREIVDVLEDSRGSIWAATPIGLHRRWADGTSAGYPLPDGLRDLSDLFEDRTGRLWIASRVGGISRLALDADRTPPRIDLTLSVGDGLPNTWVTQLFQTTDGRIWVGTAAGLAELLPAPDRNGRRFRSHTMRNGLTHGYLSAVTEDAWGNLWLSTTNAGIMKLVRDGFTSYGRQEGIEDIGAIFEDGAENLCFRGHVMASAIEHAYRGSILAWLKQNPEAGHSRFGCVNDDGIDWFYPPAVANQGWMTRKVTLRGRSGEWWIGTGSGLYRYPEAKGLVSIGMARPIAVYTTADGLAADQVFALFEDSRGDMWISTIGNTYGLARWERGSGRVRDLADAPGLASLTSELPRSFAEDGSGAVWIGFFGSIARYSSGQFRLFGPADGVPAGRINDIHLDRQQRLWLASSQGGLVRIDHADSPRPIFVPYTRREGLSTDDVEAITEDADGHLYAGGGNGIDRLDPETGRIKHFSVGDGLMPGIVNAAYRDRRGTLWFGLSTGLTRMSPGPQRPSPSPRTWITALRVSGIPQLVSARGEQQIAMPDLSARQNQVEIDFVAVGLRSGEGIRYQYRLEGADGGWSLPTKQRTVTYAALSAGQYAFAVRSVDSDGAVTEQPASIRFRILPPFWLRWWFVTLAVSVAAVLIHGFYRRRAARLLEMAHLRTRIAADLHDDIGANLTRIVLLSEVAQRSDSTSASGSAPAPSLVSIARIARESVASMGDIVWAINPARDSVADLTRRMRRHAEDLFRLHGTDLSFTGPTADDHLKLGAEVRRDVLLVFKEAVSNAARHSGCTRVDIDFAIHHARLSLVVADNGVGFDPSLESVGQGLVSMKRRAERMRGTLEIESRDQLGTTIRLALDR